MTDLIVQSYPPAVMRTKILVTTSDFVRITIPTSTPEDATMAPPTETTPDTTAAMNSYKETPPPVAFFVA